MVSFMETALHVLVRPVSYTHLDVYKRQLGYSRAKGYTLHGSEWNKHRLAFQMVSELLESDVYKRQL